MPQHQDFGLLSFPKIISGVALGSIIVVSDQVFNLCVFGRRPTIPRLSALGDATRNGTRHWSALR
jgi:hypothetical protein